MLLLQKKCSIIHCILLPNLIQISMKLARNYSINRNENIVRLVLVILIQSELNIISRISRHCQSSVGGIQEHNHYTMLPMYANTRPHTATGVPERGVDSTPVFVQFSVNSTRKYITYKQGVRSIMYLSDTSNVFLDIVS